MLLPFWEGLVKTNHYDREMRALADRHYSRQKPGTPQFGGAGRKLVLRDCAGTVLWVWLWPEHRLDEQTGYNCQIFRNESARLSSDIVLEAERRAFDYWGTNRLYTFIDPARIRSTNPGYCFQAAGWRRVGRSSERGRVILAKEPPCPTAN